MKTIIMLALALALAGCATAPPVNTEIPVGLMAQVKAMPADVQPSVLEALLVLVRAGMIYTMEWTPPTGGSAVAYYEVEVFFDSTDNSVYILHAGKDNIVVRVRGVDAEGYTGDYSQPSDTLKEVVR